MKQNHPILNPASQEMIAWKKLHLSKAAKLKELYKIQDERSRKTIESMENKGIKIECRKGCNHCCHYRVLITEQEAALISEYSGAKQKKPKRARDIFSTPDPCPFLKKGACSIYPVRPLSCRGFFVFRPTKDYPACPDIDVFAYANSPLAGIQPDLEVSIGLVSLAGDIDINDIKKPFADIRDFFDTNKK